MKIMLLFLLTTFIPGFNFAQNIYSVDIIHNSLNTSLRGLSVVDNNIIWVSGSNGYVGKSIDGGFTFEFNQIHPYYSAEFRDIEAFDENTAVVMSSVQPACILKTVDGGKIWREVFRDNRPEIFLDAIDFHNNRGVCLGDPINNKFFLLYSNDKGDSWFTPDTSKLPDARKGMAAFASSGTCIQFINRSKIMFGVGGYIFPTFYQGTYKGSKWDMNMFGFAENVASSGIFSILFFNSRDGYVVGGDYLLPDDGRDSFAYHDGGDWHPAKSQPTGYRSCIEKLNKDYLICCGTNGIDVAKIEKEINWIKISNEGFNVVQKAKKGNAVFLAGNNGKIAIMKIK